MKTARLTVAVTHMDAMLEFYNQVFDCQLTKIPGTDFHKGQFLNTPLLFCPNNIAGVKAEKNRFQWEIELEDLDSALNKVTNHGGACLDDRRSQDGVTMQGITDPDGNSFVLIGRGN